MGLRLNGEQIELMRTALVEYQRGIRDQEKYHCSGPSSVGIELCRRRLVLESILSEIEHQNHAAAASYGGPRVESIRPTTRLRIAASCEPDYVA